MRDFLTFRKMVSPLIVQVLFWVGVIVCILVGGFLIVKGPDLFGPRVVVTGLVLLVLGPVAVRLSCEFFILFFRIHEALAEILHLLKGEKTGEIGG